MNCEDCGIEIRPIDPEVLFDRITEFENGLEHTVSRCRDVLARERKETIQTLRAIEGLIQLWEAKVHSGQDAINDIRDQLLLDAELKQTLLSIEKLASGALKDEE